MIPLKKIFAYLLTIAFLYSCQKEYSKEINGQGSVATGTLKVGTSNDCLPSTLQGIYKVDSVLTSDNYIDIQVNVASTGSYTIQTNTVNGFSFSATGTFTSTGINTVRLLATGKPLAAQTSSFTIIFGTSTCVLDVPVISGSTGNAAYTFNIGSGGECSGAILGGSYKAGSALSTSNTVSVKVNVTAIGAYNIQSTTANGMVFKNSGVFSTTGVQTVILTGSGTPSSSGNTNFTISNNAGSSCTFTITVDAANTAAVFTLGSSGGNCTGVTLGGTYTSGTAMTSSNTAQIDVTVTSTGTYSITTDTKNGVSFSASGTFSQTGAQKVTLTATGTPASSGAQNFTVSAGTSTCVFAVTFSAAVGPATFTLEGAPGACTASVVNGTYTASVPLDATNTIVIKADVTVAGSYSITTTTVNGITFSASGVFSATGTGISVTLTGSGVPVSSGTTTLTPQTGGSSCSIDIPVAAAPSGIYDCTIQGVAYTFRDRAVAQTTDPLTLLPTLYLDGYVGPANGNTVPEFQIFIDKNDGSAVGVGTYNGNAFIQPINGYRIEIDYTTVNPDLSVTIWNTSSTFLTQNPPFTINVTSVTSTRVKGTFSGTLTNTFEGSTKQITVTNGTFDLPVQ